MEMMKDSKYLQTAFWKRNFKFVVFHLLNVLFVLVLFFFLNKSEESRIITDARNEALPGKTTEYFTVDGIGQMDFSFLLLLEELEHTTLLSHWPSSGLYYEVLYTCGEKDIFGGNYFQPQDFTNGNISMILGCNLKEDGKEAEEIKEIAARMEREAVVLGELPASVNAAWNDSIFYTFGRLGKMEMPPVFALSSTKEKYLKTALAAFSREISARGGTVKPCDFRQVEYQDFLGRVKTDRILFGGLVLILFLSEWASAYVMFLWRRPLRTVQFFLGKRKILFWESVKNILLLAADAVSGALLVCLVFRTPVLGAPVFLLYSVLLLFFCGSCAVCLVAVFSSNAGNALRTKKGLTFS